MQVLRFRYSQPALDQPQPHTRKKADPANCQAKQAAKDLIISCILLSIPSSTPRGGIAFTTFYLRVSQQKTKPMDWLSFL